jgi:thiosulfate dehydrogenase [quinone] large subunit
MARPVTLRNTTSRAGFGALSLARLALGATFLWAFFDKLFGLGFATCRDAATNAAEIGCSAAWVEGGSPTTGFLSYATQGPFADWFQSLTGLAWVDWLFMLGLLLIGLALTLGVALRIAAVSGSLLMLMMWAATLWPENNPAIDDHIVYIFLLGAIAAFARYQMFGLGKRWQTLPIVRRLPWLV